MNFKHYQHLGDHLRELARHENYWYAFKACIYYVCMPVLLIGLVWGLGTVLEPLYIPNRKPGSQLEYLGAIIWDLALVSGTCLAVWYTMAWINPAVKYDCPMVYRHKMKHRTKSKETIKRIEAHASVTR